MKTETAPVVPALRQSIQSQMACEHGYNLVHIQGLKPPDTLQSERGTEVHDVLAKYAVHCARQRVTADFAYLEALAYDKGQEAAEILDTCKENIEIDWQNFFAAEIHVGMDRNWEPTWSYDHDGNRVDIADVWAMAGSSLAPEHVGILDVIYAYPGGRVVRVPDYKTHPRAFDADTFQSKLYALFVFMHMPQVQEVIFELNFVRYANLKRPHTYTRADVPKLKEDVQRYRERQLQIHAKVAAGQKLSVHPGSHCTYCPAITDFSCPVAKLNPHLQLTPEERLKFRLWYDVANRANNKVMKEYVDATELSIVSQDQNGNPYVFGPVEKEKVTYPLFRLPEGETDPRVLLQYLGDSARWVEVMPMVDQFLNWLVDHPGDIPMFMRARIGATELSFLKAKKREVVHNAVKDVAEHETRTEMRIQRAAEVDDGKGEEYREYGDGEAA